MNKSSERLDVELTYERTQSYQIFYFADNFGELGL